MSRREAGYATFTVAALLSALSITGLGFMHLSQSTTSTAAALSEDILIDGALEIHAGRNAGKLGQSTNRH